MYKRLLLRLMDVKLGGDGWGWVIQASVPVVVGCLLSLDILHAPGYPVGEQAVKTHG
jgi:hypothetical protein